MKGRCWLALAAMALAACTTEFDPALLDARTQGDGGTTRNDAATVDAAFVDAAVDAAMDAAPTDAAMRDASADDAAMPDAGPAPCPAVRLIEGTAIVATSSAGALPTRGEVFRDPTFGTCLARVSDHTAEGFASVDPPERGVLSIDGHSAAPLTGSYRYHLYDLEARAPVMPFGLYSDNLVRFASDDARALYYFDAPFTIVHTSLDEGELGRVDVGATVTAELAGATGVRLAPRSTSGDGSVWALTVDTDAGRERAVITLRSSDWSAIGSRTLTDSFSPDMRDVRVGVSPSGAYVVIAIAPEETGPILALDVYSSDLATHRFGLSESDGAEAWDVARDADGHDVLVYTQRGRLMRLDLANASATPVSVLDGLWSGPTAPEYVHTDVLVSGAAIDRPGWVVLSFARCTLEDGSDCPDGTLWGQDQIALVSLGSPARVLRVAWHRSTQGGSRHPAALPSRDLHRIVFQSTWGGGMPAELYAIELTDEAIGAP